MAKKVTRLPSIPQGYSPYEEVAMKKRRACGYARVSTDKEAQESSFDNQMRHYTEYIKSRADLEFVGMYSDEGVTGTSMKHRDGFNRMIQDALDGKIDLIITKSVSRFARNTVDSLTTIRKLKENGVEVYFEEQNIYTFDSKGELLITIMSSLAQEEAHNISDNTKWGFRKRFEDGKVSVAYSTFLGYERGPNGEMVVNPEEAETVRMIYQWFLDGYSCYAIGRKLVALGIKSPAGKDNWHTSTVISILKNEKYKGDALLQKTYVEDFITKKTVKNDGSIVPQYYVTGSHEAIIDPGTFDLVQTEMARRNAEKNRHSGVSIFSSKIICGDCGSCYGAKRLLTKNGNRKIIYRCNHKYEGCHKCSSPDLSEYKVKRIFVTALNKLITNKKGILANIKRLLADLEDTKDMEQRIDDLASELDNLSCTIRNYVDKNSRSTLDQDAYQRRYAELISKFNDSKNEYDDLVEKLDDRRKRAERLRKFISNLKETKEPLQEFDPQLWCAMVEHMTVYSDKDVRVMFKDGTEIRV